MSKNINLLNDQDKIQFLKKAVGSEFAVYEREAGEAFDAGWNIFYADEALDDAETVPAFINRRAYPVVMIEGENFEKLTVRTDDQDVQEMARKLVATIKDEFEVEVQVFGLEEG